MRRKWEQKLCAFATLSLLLSSAPVGLQALGNVRINQSEPEEVYVDIIGEGERSTLFNDNWRFQRGEVGQAQDVNFNDATWASINLPHDYSIDQNFTESGEAESGFLPGGVGWYRKTFVVPEKYQDKQLMIEFDGAYMNSEVYLNGTKLGEHPYGYTAFAFDITDGLICDGQSENVLAVKTNNKIPSSRWYSGSGIYRDVTLTVSDKVHIGYNGTQIIAKDLENTKNSTVKVDVIASVENDGDTDRKVTIKNTLLDQTGKVASSVASSDVTIAANMKQDVKQEISVASPKLWSTETANLYLMKTEIMDGNKVLDTYETEYGFRYYEFNNNTGFSLNGNNLKLKGVCMHHDQGSLGAVANRDAIERQVKLLKEMGCNAIRVTHNPAASALLDVCNKYGILVINEAFDGWTAHKNGNVNDYTAHFNEIISADNQIINGKIGMKWGEFDTKAMVDSAKNDPSVIMWSIGNEVDEGTSADVSNYVNVAADIIKWIQEIDTTRLVTNGDNRKSTNPNAMLSQINQKIYEAGGVIGLNYADDTQTKAMHNAYANWPIYGSETASAVHSRGIYNTTGKDNENLQMSEYDNDSAKVGWGHSASDAWQFVIKNDFNAGEFVWTGFDYIGEPTPWNGIGSGSVTGQGAKPKSSYFGILDTAGFAKDTYYLYKSMWDDNSTTLHLISTWNDNDIVKKANGKVKVDVFTNAAKVELYLNGSKIGEDSAKLNKTAVGYTYQTFSNGEFYPSFDVDWAPGTLSAKAYDKEGNLISNTEGRDSVTTNSAATKLEVVADKKEIQADGSSLSYITVDVKDENNNVVANANNRVQFSVQGNGKIIAVDNGNPTDTDSYQADSRKAFSGKALVIVQSTKKEGAFTLTATSDGLTSASTTVKTKRSSEEGSEYLQSYTISKNVYIGIDDTLTLPSAVMATYNNGNTKELKVVWNEYDKELLSQVGNFNVMGSLENSDVMVSVTVHVIGEIVAMENYSTMTSLHVVPNLPQTLRGLYENGTYSEPFPVQWNINENDFAKEGLVDVEGTASVLNTTKEVKATIRVTGQLAKATNIAATSFKDQPKFMNGKMVDGVASEPTTNAISDSLNKLNDGITNDSSATDARWTNWSIRDENPATDTYIQLDWQEAYAMQNVKLWHFTDSQYSVLPGDDNVRFEYFDNDTNVWKEIESSHITQVSYLSGDTPYGFIHPITTNKLRIWMKAPMVGKCIGLTEVEVYDYVPPVFANTTANIDVLKLNNVDISDFEGYVGYDEKTKTYSISLEKAEYPTVSATSNNNEAITILPVYQNEVKIIAKAEDGNATNTYTVKYNVKVNKDVLKQYLNNENVKKALAESNVYTETSYKQFSQAYEVAKQIVNDSNVTQSEVDNSYHQLKTAYESLVKEDVTVLDKSKLQAALTKAESVSDDLLNQVEASIAKEFIDAFEVAKQLLGQVDVTQIQIDKIVIRLLDAIDNLKVEIVDKSDLKALIIKAENLEAEKYTSTSWQLLKTALTRAKEVEADKDVTKGDVETAIKELQAAINKLEKKPSGGNASDITSSGTNTGDTTHMMLWLSLLGASIFLLGVRKKMKISHK